MEKSFNVVATFSRSYYRNAREAMKKIKLPQVVIVGRTNVGKSTLFNRLSENVKAIALDREGVTRDFIRDTISWQGRSFELIDTGGISLRKTQDPILSQSRAIAVSMIES